MRVVAIIQARLGSTRLPGKVLETLGDRTVLAQVVRRVQAASRVDAVVVATSTLAQDAAVAREATAAGAIVCRGSEQDVLARYHQAALENEAEVIVRVTSDCPLFDPALLDRMLEIYLVALDHGQAYDYYSNTLDQRTFPTGLDAEIFTMAALARANAEADQPFEREHVTPYFYQHPERFSLGGLTAETDHSDCRWTLDTPADLALLRRIYEALEKEDELITTSEALALLAAEPDLALLNSEVAVKPLASAPAEVGGLVIRADASPHLGAGHLLRCLALAQAWPGAVCFALAEGIEQYGDRLLDEGFPVVPISAAVASPADAAATGAVAGEQQAQWLAVDGYRFDNSYFAALARSEARLLVLDDCGRVDLPPVDLVLNQNLQAAEDLYPGRAATTRLLLGPRYVLLRQEFLLPVPPETKRPAEELRVLVTLGGGDPGNVTRRIVAGLLATGVAGLRIRALVDNTSPHLAGLHEMAQASGETLAVLTGVTDMPAQYRWADGAVTAGGGTLWELAYLGVPAVTVVVADNQERTSRLLAERGAIICLGRTHEFSDEELVAALGSFLRDTSLRQRLVDAGRDLIDGRGGERVVGTMLGLARDEVKA